MAEMDRKLVFVGLLLFTILLLIGQSLANKYSEESNIKKMKKFKKNVDPNKDYPSKWDKEKRMKEAFDKQENPFRIHKVNLVWQKAKKRLSSDKLAELFVDLKQHDKTEMKLKAMRVEGQDEDGSLEAEVRSKFLKIMETYGMSGTDKQQMDNRIDENNVINEKYDSDIITDKMDKKLARLWEKAKLAAFSDEELNDLKSEFMHHQRKLDEFKMLKNEISAMDGLSDNSIEGIKQTGLDKTEQKQKRKDLKHKHKDVLESYRILEEKSIIPDNTDHSFTEPKVLELWVLAKRANFSEVELSSFKEELKHFEHKLKKQEYFRDQVDVAKKGPKKFKNNHIEKPRKHLELEEKAKDYDFKVKKHHTELKRRIAVNMGMPHTEL